MSHPLLDGAQSENAPRLLAMLHREGPRSRAQLTAATGLNRSTIAALVAGLVEAGLVVERAPEATQRVGRPSPLVSAAPGVVAIAANPEVDGIRLAAVGLGGGVRLRRTVRMDEPPSPEEAARAIAAVVTEWREAELADALVVGIGLAVPGLVRASDGVVALAPHLGWRDAPLGALVAGRTALAVQVGNDASLGALAEHRFGAGIGHDDLVYLNGGPSGIGGGVLIAGRLVRGSAGYAGEFGHLIASFRDPADRRTASGKLEDEVNAALLAGAVGSGADGAEREAARQRRVLASGVANAINVLDPTAVVLGGSLAALVHAHEAEVDDLVAAELIRPPEDRVRIAPAALAEDRLLVGAAEIAFAGLLAQPPL